MCLLTFFLKCSILIGSVISVTRLDIILILTKKMLEQFPHSGLKGKPHIESKIKILKRQLGYIIEAQKRSWIGWNDELKMITGDKDIFTDWAKGRDGAPAIYMKHFPLYDKLCEIYSNDSASGSIAKGPGDDGIGDDSGNVKIDDVSISSSTQATEPSGSRRDRKRRRDVENDEIATLSKSLASLIEVEKEATLVMSELQKYLCMIRILKKRETSFLTLCVHLKLYLPMKLWKLYHLLGWMIRRSSCFSPCLMRSSLYMLELKGNNFNKTCKCDFVTPFFGSITTHTSLNC